MKSTDSLRVGWSGIDDVVRYVRARGAKQLEECDDALQDIGEELERLKAASDEALSVSRKLETDIAQGDANLANLRGNKDMRKQVLEISDTEKELKSIDLDEAAKASRNYQAKWDEGTAEEKRLNNEVRQSVGECSVKSQYIFLSIFVSEEK